MLRRSLLVACALMSMAAAPTRPTEPKPDNKPKVYENAEHKFKFKAPAAWESVTGGCHGSLFQLCIPGHATSASVREKDGSTMRYLDTFIVAVNPLKNPDAGLDGAVQQLQDEMKAEIPGIELKAAEKSKAAGQDAATFTTLLPKPDPKEKKPRGAERYTVFVRDGKVFEFIVMGHTSSLAQSSAMAKNIEKTFEWTGEAKNASAAAK